MIYDIKENGIFIKDTNDFNPEHILECGQVFSFEKNGDDYYVFPQDKFAKVFSKDDGYMIETKDIQFFIDYFDLNRDYFEIKQQLSKFTIMKEPIKFGYGIRILNQNLLETLVSFIISANNNIKRIKAILQKIKESLNPNSPNIFPSLEQLSHCDEDFFRKAGAGYRAKYLVNVFKQIDEKKLDDFRNLDTPCLRKELMNLSGVGPKVADCILLFGYKRGDVFPVDTWIHQMYNEFYSPLENREKIRNNLIKEFGSLSGYAQQYLFYYQRMK